MSLVLFLSVTRPKPPLGKMVIVTFNHATCDVNSPKAVKTLMYGKCMHVTDIVFFIVYIFFWFYRSVGLKANIKYTKKGVTSAMECADVADFTFAT